MGKKFLQNSTFVLGMTVLSAGFGYFSLGNNSAEAGLTCTCQGSNGSANHWCDSCYICHDCKPICDDYNAKLTGCQ